MIVVSWCSFFHTHVYIGVTPNSMFTAEGFSTSKKNMFAWGFPRNRGDRDWRSPARLRVWLGHGRAVYHLYVEGGIWEY